MVDKVLTIPLRINLVSDAVIWKHTTDGIYSVKFGYHIALSLINDVEASSYTYNEALWRNISKKQVTPKCINLVWKTCRNILPVRENMIRKMPQMDPICPYYGEMEETLKRLFLPCLEAKSVWFASQLSGKITTESNLQFIAWLNGCLSTNDMSFFGEIIWPVVVYMAKEK
ncbi:uncharacterized protein LOC114424175 [Glycine soja]|uniref:uncharacterized protein LOC114424175 n=1 Tax=Glycine soja TaxID=3848 RepID=UPI0010403FDA|nr:uncharacterized protein LOC114424175 [Glycine soja]